MRALFQLLGAVTAVAAAGLGVAVLAKKLGKEFPIKVTVDVAEDAEQDKETADKTAAAYEAGVAACNALAESIDQVAQAHTDAEAEEAEEAPAPETAEPEEDK